MAFEGLIRSPKIELYVGVVKRVSPIWINFEVNGEAPASRRSGLDRDDEQPRVGEQDPPVWLNRISILETVAVSGEKLAALLVGEPLEERLQGRAGEPVGDALGPIEGMNIGGHPDIDLRSRGPEPIVIFVVVGDERLG